MISINWQQIIAYLLLSLSGLGGIAYGGKIAWTKFRTAKPGVSKSVESEGTSRAADEPAPAGAIEWVNDICEAMGAASAETKLKALVAGSTRDNARALRISELEAAP